jgi:hypothetical protein
MDKRSKKGSTPMGFLDSENKGLTAGLGRLQWKLSQVPQKCAPDDVKMSGKNNFGEVGESPCDTQNVG